MQTAARQAAADTTAVQQQRERACVLSRHRYCAGMQLKGMQQLLVQ
jgi:hypothetical protein